MSCLHVSHHKCCVALVVQKAGGGVIRSIVIARAILGLTMHFPGGYAAPLSGVGSLLLPSSTVVLLLPLWRGLRWP
jgi:hypothetical protein